MRSLNQCNFIGNLGADPETRFTPSGDCVTTFSIGVSDDYTKDGERVSQTEWVRVVAWRKLGEVCAEYLKKGSKVFITGKMKTRSWEQDGIKRYATEIIANEMQMLDGRRDGEQRESGQRRQEPTQHRPAAQHAEHANHDNFDDDIPF
jgi:single-strand DNA-binding protein